MVSFIAWRCTESDSRYMVSGGTEAMKFQFRRLLAASSRWVLTKQFGNNLRSYRSTYLLFSSQSSPPLGLLGSHLRIRT